MKNLLKRASVITAAAVLLLTAACERNIVPDVQSETLPPSSVTVSPTQTVPEQTERPVENSPRITVEILDFDSCAELVLWIPNDMGGSAFKYTVEEGFAGFECPAAAVGASNGFLYISNTSASAAGIYSFAIGGDGSPRIPVSDASVFKVGDPSLLDFLGVCGGVLYSATKAFDPVQNLTTELIIPEGNYSFKADDACCVFERNGIITLLVADGRVYELNDDTWTFSEKLFDRYYRNGEDFYHYQKNSSGKCRWVKTQCPSKEVENIDDFVFFMLYGENKAVWIADEVLGIDGEGFVYAVTYEQEQLFGLETVSAPTLEKYDAEGNLAAKALMPYRNDLTAGSIRFGYCDDGYIYVLIAKVRSIMVCRIVL